MELQKKFIRDEAGELSDDEKKTILQIIKRHDSKLILTYADGSRIILDKLPDNIIGQIYNFMQHKLNIS